MNLPHLNKEQNISWKSCCTSCTVSTLSENGNKKTCNETYTCFHLLILIIWGLIIDFVQDAMYTCIELCSTYTAPKFFIRKSEEYRIFFSPLPTKLRLKLLIFLEIQYIRSRNRLSTWICKGTIQLSLIISICLRMVYFYWNAAPVQQNRMTRWQIDPGICIIMTTPRA